MNNTTIRELNATEINLVSGGFTIDFGFKGLRKHSTEYNLGDRTGGHERGKEFNIKRGLGFEMFTGVKSVISSIFTSHTGA